MTIGAAIRNEKVTPSGTPAETKPTNKGTAEQEQNGVKTPRARRRDIGDALAPAGEQGARALWREETANDSHAEDDEGQQHQDFGRVEGEEAGGLFEARARRNRKVRNEPGRERLQTPVDREPERDGGKHARDPRRGRWRARSRLREKPGAHAALRCGSGTVAMTASTIARVAGGRSAESR